MRFNRFEALIGKEQFAQLKQKKVAIFGIGGVGSYALEAIARSGIGHIIICDFDHFEASNINRQLYAYDSTIGALKVDVAKARLEDINPDVEVLSYALKADADIIKEIFALKPDFVIDAIDDVFAKTDLIKASLLNGIPFISSMGFANKIHPEKIKIASLKETSVCPLAKTMRKRLREEKVSLDFPVVYSTEKPIESIGKILGTSPYVPSIAGLMMSGYVINKLIGA